MKAINVVSLLPILILLSTFVHLLKLPAEEETLTDRGNDPFSLLNAQISSKHRDMLLKLRKLHHQTNGSCLLYISILLVTLSNDVQLNPGPRPPKYKGGSCGQLYGTIRIAYNVMVVTTGITLIAKA